jgi:hypothetical protein
VADCLFLEIAYRSNDGRLRSVAEINDAGLLLKAGRLAIEQAKERANALRDDPIMFELKMLEVGRMSLALECLIPGLVSDAPERTR